MVGKNSRTIFVQFEKSVTRYKNRLQLAYFVANCMWLLTQSWLISLLSSLIARRKIRPQSVSDDQCLTINTSGRVHRGPICGFLLFLLLIAIAPFALFHCSVLIICISLDVSQTRQKTLCEPNIHL